MILDDWQKEFIEYQGDKILVAGRQTGKSEAQAYDNALFAVENEGVNCLLISRTERQAEELLVKTLNFLSEYYPHQIMKGKDRPTKHLVNITHGKGKKQSKIMCMPTGLAGEGIRGFTIHKLSADEAQLIEDAVFQAVTPMLLTTGGKISLTGTPQGKRGFFWEAYKNEHQQFKVFHVNSEEVLEKRPINQFWTQWKRDSAFKHLEVEKARMTVKQYAQEYLGEFVEDLNSLFPDELIKECCVLKREPIETGRYYLGVDVARLGDDLSSFQVVQKISEREYKQRECLYTRKTLTTQTYSKILELNTIWNFKQIGIDAGAGSLGVGLLDFLLREDSVKRKVIALNNRKRILDSKDESKVKLQKEDMYMNLLALMQQKKIKLLDDDELILSLKSVQYEYIITENEKSKTKVFTHLNSDIVEGLIRAVQLALQDTSQELFCLF